MPGHLGCCGQRKGQRGSEPLVPEGAGSRAWAGLGMFGRMGSGPAPGQAFSCLDLGETAASVAAWPQAGLAGEQQGLRAPGLGGLGLGLGTAHSFAPDGPQLAAPRRSGDSVGLVLIPKRRQLPSGTRTDARFSGSGGQGGAGVGC